MAPQRVLVVDDDLMIRLNTAEILEEAGFEVIEACDAASALVVVKLDPSISLVCTDVQMPGELDGIDLAKWLRNRRPDIRVIVMSCYDKLEECPAEVPFLKKPFLSRRLVQLAQEQLGALA